MKLFLRSPGGLKGFQHEVQRVAGTIISPHTLRSQHLNATMRTIETIQCSNHPVEGRSG